MSEAPLKQIIPISSDAYQAIIEKQQNFVVLNGDLEIDPGFAFLKVKDGSSDIERPVWIKSVLHKTVRMLAKSVERPTDTVRRWLINDGALPGDVEDDEVTATLIYFMDQERAKGIFPNMGKSN